MRYGEVPTEEELDHFEKVIHDNMELFMEDAGSPPERWNTMKDMRKAFGLPLGNDGIAEFLDFWDSLNSAQRTQLRRGDLANIADWDIHAPASNKENS